MRFLHLGDLHIGKILHGRSLIDDQAYALKQVIQLIKEEEIPLVIIAGDLYDRSIPTIEAIELLNVFLDVLINELKVQVFIISGNHDSAERLNFASSILKDKGLVIETSLEKKIATYTLQDAYGDICFHLVPFFKPSKIRTLFEEDSIKTYQDAFQYYLKYNKEAFVVGKRHVLVTHHFLSSTTKNSITSESESPLSVGGIEIIDASIVKDFDYVALGHLHAPQSVGYPHVRYSGSLLKYSVDEALQNKSVCIVEIQENKNIITTLKELNILHDVRILEGYFEDILENKEGNLEDYVALSLQDTTMITNAMDKVRLIYPNALMITYQFYKERLNSNEKIEFVDAKGTSDEVLFSTFYKQVTGIDLDATKEALFLELLEDYRKEKEHED